VRSRSFVAVAVTLLLLCALAAGVAVYDGSQQNTIAKGIRIGGVEVGGLSAAQARLALGRAYAAQLHRPLVLHFAGRRFVVAPSRLHLRVLAGTAIEQALERSRSDDLFTRVARSLGGGRINADFEPQVRYSNVAVNGIVTRVSRALGRPARDAQISYSGSSIAPVSSRPGQTISRTDLAGRIESALADPGAGRTIRIPVERTDPKLSTRALAARYPTIITVDRSAFRLRLWKHLRLARTYPIAVGMAGLETPAGLYHVQDKQVNPSWHVPNSAWAGSLAGQVIPPGPADPIKARWMGIFNGAGIHGTEELSSLGSAASHGCIRMAIPDVIDLYDQTSVGTPVFIA
jgi:lipoprotein-anchoring transpeptidase ErfK/SrfK